MIEQLTISVSSFEVNNIKLRTENDKLQQMLEAKTVQDSLRQLNVLTINGTDSKENIRGMNSKTQSVSHLQLGLELLNHYFI